MEQIKQLVEIVETLKTDYKDLKMKFTLDGNLVGDIGEVLAQEKYEITLYDANHAIHDGYCPDGKEVQIKSTMVGKCYVSSKIANRPKYFLFIHIKADGKIDEIYNGPADFIYKEYITFDMSEEEKGNFENETEIKKGNASGYRSLSMLRLKRMNEKVDRSEKIQLKQ